MKWPGYSLDELQSLLERTDMLIENEKKILQENVREVKAVRDTSKTVTRKVLSALSYVDYLMIGLTVFRKLRSVVTRFRK